MKKDLLYYAIEFGGYPMTPKGAERYLTAAKLAGYTTREAIKLVPNEFRATKWREV